MLTTNLLKNIDEAVFSRVHMHLIFSDFSYETRIIFWKRFLSLAQFVETNSPNSTEVTTSSAAEYLKLELPETAVKELASWRLNGRQIKNIIHAARSWCHFSGEVFSLAKLLSTIKVTAPFAERIDDSSSVDEVSRKRRRLDSRDEN